MADKEANISYLRIFATICVIWLHTCSTLTDNQDLFILSQQQIPFFRAAYQMMYWAVPVFFMITGALLLNTQKILSVRIIVKKYILRIFLALFIFGIPFAMLKLIVESHSIRPFQFFEAIIAVLENNGFGHLWYLYTIIGIYFVLPVLKLYINHASNKEIKYILFVLFIFCFAIPLINNLFKTTIAFDIPFKYPLFYIILGHYINIRRDYIRFRLWNIAAIALCVIAIWIINYVDWMPIIWTSYSSPLIACISSMVFIAFMKSNFEKRDFIWKIDRCCFGMYLIHPLFIHFTYRFLKISPIDFKYYYLATILLFMIFVICSFIAIYMAQKIGFLKKYVL